MRSYRAHLAICTCLWLAFGALAPVEGGAAGNPCASVGASENDSGIGGTGVADPDSGIGGTGFGDPDSGVGGTGVLGTVTGFASLCVNGLEIEFAENVPVALNGSPGTSADLAIGQLIWVIADEEEDEFVARSIDVLSAIVGAIDAIDTDAAWLRIAGEEIELLPDAIVLANSGGAPALEIGARVAVSGLRRPDGRILASRIDAAGSQPDRSSLLGLAPLIERAPGIERVIAQGYAASAGGETHLAGMRLEIDGIRPPPTERVRVTGRLVDGGLRAERWTLDRPARPEPPDRAEPPPAPGQPGVKPIDRPAPPDVPPTPDLPEPIDRPEPPEPVERPVVIERPEPIERPDGARLGQ